MMSPLSLLSPCLFQRIANLLPAWYYNFRVTMVTWGDPELSCCDSSTISFITGERGVGTVFWGGNAVWRRLWGLQASASARHSLRTTGHWCPGGSHAWVRKFTVCLNDGFYKLKYYFYPESLPSACVPVCNWPGQRCRGQISASHSTPVTGPFDDPVCYSACSSLLIKPFLKPRADCGIVHCRR